jgi:hypothetical protein
MPPSLDLALYPWIGTLNYWAPPGAGASFRTTVNCRPSGYLWETPPFVDEIFRIYVFKLLAINKKPSNAVIS